MEPNIVVRRRQTEDGVERVVEIDNRWYEVTEVEVADAYDFMRKIAAEDREPNDLRLRMTAWLENFEADIQRSQSKKQGLSPAS